MREVKGNFPVYYLKKVRKQCVRSKIKMLKEEKFVREISKVKF